MGQLILHRSERRRVAAICAAALNEREAQARRKAPKPPSSQRGCREFTHENDSYRDLFWGERGSVPPVVRPTPEFTTRPASTSRKGWGQRGLTATARE